LEKNRSKYRAMFVQEAHEHIQNLNERLLKLEDEPDVAEHVDSLFRSAHTLKGMAATLEYANVVQLSKAVEDVFEKLRKGSVELSGSLTNSLFACFDALEEAVDNDGKKMNLEPLLEALRSPSYAATTAGTEARAQLPTQLPSIRVRMSDLDSLVDLVGELVILKMRLEQEEFKSHPGDYREAMTALGRLVSDLQDQTMKIRLVSVDQIFNRFPRMVRDLAASQGKEVRLEMEGLEIKLDRTVLDAITEPLLHILRNSVDHGIEASAERKRLGKPPTGTVRIGATRVGNRIAIQVDDDGRGIDAEKIRSVAVQKKIVSATEAEHMTDEEVFDILGAAGLTESKTATDVSGRGVGLNVARNQMQKIGGQVKIESEKGVGTRMTLMVPISLAIVGGLQVKAADETYILPLSAVKSVIQVDNSEIKSVGGVPAVVLRSELIPLRNVADSVESKKERRKTSDAKTTIVIVDRGGKSLGLVVDSVEGEQAVVTRRLDGTGPFTNATILPDGRVVLMFDPAVAL